MEPCLRGDHAGTTRLYVPYVEQGWAVERMLEVPEDTNSTGT